MDNYKKLLNYLTKDKGKNLQKITPDLRKIKDNYRFDDGFFDILAASTADNSINGIIIRDTEIQELETKLEWIERLGGKIILITETQSSDQYKKILPEKSSGIQIYTYTKTHEDYTFKYADDTKENPPRQKETINEKISKTLKSPELINYILTKYSKTNPALKLLQVGYNTYRKTR